MLCCFASSRRSAVGGEPGEPQPDDPAVAVGLTPDPSVVDPLPREADHLDVALPPLPPPPPLYSAVGPCSCSFCSFSRATPAPDAFVVLQGSSGGGRGGSDGSPIPGPSGCVFPPIRVRVFFAVSIVR